jgi:methylmalonyl-CoA mutase
MTTAATELRVPVRFITAAALFDGHDASINVIRRVLQEAGCEVIHLGHNRSVHEIVTAAVQEDAQGVAVSSYQGGHLEFFAYLRRLLDERGAGHVRIFGGGGGTIVPREIEYLQAHGVERVFSPEDGRRLGLEGMIREMVRATARDPLSLGLPDGPEASEARVARLITAVERPDALRPPAVQAAVEAALHGGTGRSAPVIGITGPGGAGKSSFTDEFLLRFLREIPQARAAVIAVDPTKRRTGGALLGDRIRMNAVYDRRVFFRSMATRRAGAELSEAVRDAVRVLQAEGFDLVLVETSGIGQGGSGVVDLADVSVYVMTPEYGAASQLEKIDMLDLADVVVVNKMDRRGGADALRDVRKQFRRARKLFHAPGDAELPVFGAVAAVYNDPGVTAACRRILDLARERTGEGLPPARREAAPGPAPRPPLIGPRRSQYLAEIAATVRAYHAKVEDEAATARRWQALERSEEALSGDPGLARRLREEAERVRDSLSPATRDAVIGFSALRDRYRGEELVVRVRDREVRQPLHATTLAGTRIPRIAVPRTEDRGEIVRFLGLENLPGGFPFTAGVFALKRSDEDPKRMFAGEGSPGQTNRRFHFLCREETAKRLSTAFDSVTLYGRDPDERPDIFGKVGESGVSVATLEDMRTLYRGFDLCDPNTSVSMTINGPAPILLAMFLNTAIDQQREAFAAAHGRPPSPGEDAALQARTLATVRGTVQADILKEDQAQNTCIFSTEFALRLMGDVQAFFIEHDVRNYYSVSISGYHIAEAGANPITQLAFTLANGFTYVESYLARGMAVDDFAPNLSFFFSNGLDAEYAVLGRVARRIWAVAMRDLYRANERSQKLKYHVQTSGRSLHAQEMAFNDIRTTLQALLALQDNCNSLHTNAYDEAVTTPTEESVRRAMAIQYIITKEFGLAQNENALQGSYIIEELTDLVEEAVLREFDRLSERGGVLGAMETEYQRGRIQEESLLYERLKHEGRLPIVGVTTFVNEQADHSRALDSVALTRCPEEVKRERVADVRAFQALHAGEAPAALGRLKEVCLAGGNVFAELMRTVRVASLGQISRALFEVGGEYRRNM